MKSVYLAACAAVAILAGAPAQAAPVITTVNANLLTAPFTAAFQGATFTFSATNNIFAPLNVQSNSSGAYSAFGGFLGIPLSPTSSFTNRGTVTYGPSSGAFASFATTTNVASSNGENFIGLRAMVGNDYYYGFAFTTNNVLNSYGFETAANTAITATTALSAVPEPATWGMMILGMGIVGFAMRRRGSKVMTKVAFA